MQDWIVTFVSQYGYLGVTLLIFVENIFPPIPSELILTFAGFMTTYTTMTPWLAALFATIGSLMGALVLYAVGRFLSPERLGRLLDGRTGKILRLKREHIQKAEVWFAKRQGKAVFLCRFVPIVRSLISIPAGMAKMSMLPFLTLTAIGSAIWNAALVWIGAIAGNAWQSTLKYTDLYTKIVLAAAVVIVVAVVAVWYFRRRKKKSRENKDA